ncbi:nucleotide pyrophosphohydrolase [Candidatus Gracilibacteria bacterium]|nr:nucleotide pyrophosphohydrolase [Candidatus Gracilibacteria bacterium]
MSNFLKKYFDLVEQKFNANTVRSRSKTPLDSAEYLHSKKYFEGMIEEIEEAKQEVKQDNSVYLETELGDIFWTYLNTLYCLEQEGYISKEKVFERCLKKFSERTEGIQEGVLWNSIKEKQKHDLLQEHNEKYS